MSVYPLPQYTRTHPDVFVRGGCTHDHASRSHQTIDLAILKSRGGGGGGFFISILSPPCFAVSSTWRVLSSLFLFHVSLFPSVLQRVFLFGLPEVHVYLQITADFVTVHIVCNPHSMNQPIDQRIR